LLMMAKTSGQATPVKISAGTGALPEWSPTGGWIAVKDPAGWHLVSADGGQNRFLGQISSSYLTFSRDGQTLYGVRSEDDRQLLFSIPAGGGPKKTIGEIPRELAPRMLFNIGMRYSVSPDGKSLLYSTVSTKTSLWMLEGFD
jgi:hypothetical protein